MKRTRRREDPGLRRLRRRRETASEEAEAETEGGRGGENERDASVETAGNPGGGTGPDPSVFRPERHPNPQPSNLLRLLLLPRPLRLTSPSRWQSATGSAATRTAPRRALAGQQGATSIGPRRRLAFAHTDVDRDGLIGIDELLRAEAFASYGQAVVERAHAVWDYGRGNGAVSGMFTEEDWRRCVDSRREGPTPTPRGSGFESQTSTATV